MTEQGSSAYDAADRLQTLTSPAGSYTYTYKGPGTVWTNLSLPTSPAAAITNVYDTGDRLTGTYLRNSAGAILNQHVYLLRTFFPSHFVLIWHRSVLARLPNCGRVL